MNACIQSEWPSMKVEPLQDSQKMQIITDYLEGIYSKTLTTEQKEMIVNVKQTSNPLYLKSLLDEVQFDSILNSKFCDSITDPYSKAWTYLFHLPNFYVLITCTYMYILHTQCKFKATNVFM